MVRRRRRRTAEDENGDEGMKSEMKRGAMRNGEAQGTCLRVLEWSPEAWEILARITFASPKRNCQIFKNNKHKVTFCDSSLQADSRHSCLRSSLLIHVRHPSHYSNLPSTVRETRGYAGGPLPLVIMVVGRGFPGYCTSRRRQPVVVEITSLCTIASAGQVPLSMHQG